MKKKRILKVLGSLFFLGVVAAGGVCWYSRTSNPWNAKRIGDISAPIGYSRVEAPQGSYAAWLRELPLKKKGTKVKLYTGGDANFQCSDMRRGQYASKRGTYCSQSESFGESVVLL